jgi:hypothetical protein
VGLAAAAYGLLGEAGLSQKLTQVIFVGLAALTFPHMLLAAVSQGRQRNAARAGVRGFGAPARRAHFPGESHRLSKSADMIKMLGSKSIACLIYRASSMVLVLNTQPSGTPHGPQRNITRRAV